MSEQPLSSACPTEEDAARDEDAALKPTERPNYTSPYKLTYSEIEIPPPIRKLSGQFRKNRMQRRIVSHTIVLSLMVLLLVLVGLLGTGLWQMVHFSRNEIKDIVSDFRTYSTNFVSANQTVLPQTASEFVSSEQREKAQVHYAEKLLTSFIAIQNPPSNGALLAFVNGGLVAHDENHGENLHLNRQLMRQVETGFKSPDSHIVSISTQNDQKYLVGIIPVHVENTDKNIGHLVVLYDYSKDIQRIRNQIQLFAGISLFILTVVSLMTMWSTMNLLAPLSQLRHMMKSIVTQQDLSKRLPIPEEEDDLSEVSRQANLMIERMQLLFQKQNELLNDVGHELRTPITVVRGHLELMDTSDPLDVQETRHYLLNEIDHMERLIDDLIVVAKTDNPNFLTPEHVDLGGLLLDVYEQASMLGDFRWSIEHLEACEAYVDPGRIRQVLLQLAQNATKFSEPGSVIAFGLAVNHASEILDANGNRHVVTETVAPYEGHVQQVPAIESPYYATLWVRDTGRGIDPRNQQRIFERFARVDHSVPGSGLGLAIASAIAEAHRGTLSLRSLPNIGSLFTLKIPISEDDFAATLEGEENE